MANENKFKRLSKSVQPVNYNIKLHPNLEKFTFSGHEIIDIIVKKETKKIKVNCIDIQVSSAVFQSDEQAVACSHIEESPDEECVSFLFPTTLPIGSAKLIVTFVGELNDKMKGFYRSKYKNTSGEEVYCAVTQFEATDARRAFPCWDEPAIKATFDITIVAPKNRVVLSNMDVKGIIDYEEDDQLQVVSFQRSPKMSTYLVAFVIGEFDYVEGKTTDDVLVRVYTPLGKSEQGEFGLQIALKTLPFYNQYFGIAYPLPKMDLIAIPDFAAGAMENWGLVTYRETCLLVDSTESSAASKQWVALVVGHEIAHQWFGNLTTMEWWTHLWLNEGFASFIEYMCVDHCCPEYDIWTQFVTNDFVKALQLDGMKNSHPIEVTVGHPSEIDEIFDAISYSKGASVIRMLHHYIGDEDFKAGLNSYLTTFKYNNASTDDLWEHLERRSSKPVGKVMSTWTKQMGYPVIYVSSEQSQSQRIVKLQQKKFNADGTEDDEKKTWAVPISITTSKDLKKVKMLTLMSDPDMVIFLENTPNDVWLKLNPGQMCFHRTCYSSEMLKQMIPGIKLLPAVDRLGIENDLFALSIAGFSETCNFLDVLTGYIEESDYTVWSDLNANIGLISLLLQNTDYHEVYQKFVCSMYRPVAARLGWNTKENDDHLTPMLRNLILSRLGVFGDDDTVKECQRRFQDHIEGVSPIAADLRAAVYRTVAANGNEIVIDQLMALYKQTAHMEEKDRILRCLGATKDTNLIAKVLEFALSDDVRSQDTVFGISGCTGSLQGRHQTWQFVKEKWDVLEERYKGGFLLNRLVKVSTECFATKEEANDVQNFFNLHHAPGAERAIKQSLENIMINEKWLSRERQNVLKWLSAR